MPDIANIAENKMHLRELDFQIDSSGNEENILSGLAIVYKSDSKPMYSFMKRTKYIERILPGSITESLANNDIRCLFAHDNKYVLGRTQNDTLKLHEQIEGLFFSVDIPDTTWARDLSTSVKRGDFNKMSFGFYPLKSRWLDDESTVSKYGMPVHEISKLHLSEISIVSNPAYTQTDVRDLESIENLETSQNKANIELKNKARAREIEILKIYTPLPYRAQSGVCRYVCTQSDGKEKSNASI